MFINKIIFFIILSSLSVLNVNSQTDAEVKTTKNDPSLDLSQKTQNDEKNIQSNKRIFKRKINKNNSKNKKSRIFRRKKSTSTEDDSKINASQEDTEIKSKEDKEEEKQIAEKKDISLNFENAELSNFVNYISELKNINLIPDEKLKGQKISLTIREPLTVDGAWNVFLTVLEMGGFSIIKRGDVEVIIPKAQKAKQPLPAYLNTPIDELPESDLNIRYVTFLQNISVNDIQGLLKGMLSVEGFVVPYPQVNGLIITGKSLNIKAGMKIINELDQTGLQESVVVMKLKTANAQDIKELFDNLIKSPEGNPLARLLGKQAESTLEYFSPTTRIIAEERTNSLILLGNRKSIQKIEDFVVEHLDTELKEVQSPLHIYELQNTDAEQIKNILESVTEPSGDKAKYGAVRGGVKYFKKMNFQVDKDGNRLIVSSTDKQDWKLLKKTIEDLDKPQPQVALETLIVTVDFNDEKEFGGAIRNKKEGEIGKGVNAQSPSPGGIQQGSGTDSNNNLLGNMLSGFTGEVGSTLLSIGSKTNIWAAFKALKKISNTTVLSQPFFTTENKTKASINIGTERQVLVQTSGSNSGYENQEASTKIDITPQINLEGIIRLNIKINISEFQSDTGSSGDKYTKDLDTDVSLADGQVLVLGGFIKTKVTESMIKTPLLGDIPILGWLFKNKKRTITKSYLFVFMSPTIIKPRQNPGTNLYTRMKLHQATNNIEDSVQTKSTNDPIHNWFFNPDKEDYSHKVTDFANARYQPTTVDIKNDPYYRTELQNGLKEKKIKKVIIENDKEIDDQTKDNETFQQKKEKLTQLLNEKPVVEAKKKLPPKITANKNKRNKFKQFISENPETKKNDPTLAQNSLAPINEPLKKISTLEEKQLKLKELLQSTPQITENIETNLNESVDNNNLNNNKKRAFRELKKRNQA